MFMQSDCLIVKLYLLLNICIALRPEDSPPPPSKVHGPAVNGTGEFQANNLHTFIHFLACLMDRPAIFH